MILPRILIDHECWLRLSALFHLHNERLYRYILYSCCKLPSDPQELYKLISKKKNTFKYLVKSCKLSFEQYDTIFPANEITDINKFDVTTFVAVVRYCTKMKPRGGWVLARQLKSYDKSKGALLLDLEQYYIENLEEVEPIHNNRFEDDWDELVYIFSRLKFNTMEVLDLKTCEINAGKVPDKYTEAILKAQIEFLRSTQRSNANKLRTLQSHEASDEVEADVLELLERNNTTQKNIDKLYELTLRQENWQELYLELAEIDNFLMEIKSKIDFLQQLLKLEHFTFPKIENEKGSGEDKRKFIFLV